MMAKKRTPSDVYGEELWNVIETLRVKRGLDQEKLIKKTGVNRTRYYEAKKSKLSFKPEDAQAFFSVLTEPGPEGRVERALLRKAFLKNFLREWAEEESVSEAIAPRLTLKTPFVEDLLQVPVPAAPEGRTVARLLGGAVFAIKILEVLTAHPDYGFLTPERRQVPLLLESIKVSIANKGMIDFTQTPDFAAWVLGACRNIASHAVAVVLERCLFEWVQQHKGDDVAHASYKQEFVEQLKQLKDEPTLSRSAWWMAMRLYITLRYYKEKIYTFEGAIGWLTNTQKFPRTLSLQELFKRLASPKARLRCTALAYMLDTAVVYEEEPYTINYNKSFVIALQALLWVAEFRRHLFNLPR